MTWKNQPEAIQVLEPTRCPGPFGPSRATRDALVERVLYARQKHPWSGVSNGYRLRVLLSEVRELIWAVIWERRPGRIRDEALDVAAVAVRWIEGDG